MSNSTKPIKVITSVVENHRSLEIKGLPRYQSKWFYTPPDPFNNTIWQVYNRLDNYVLGFPELFFTLKDGAYTINENTNQIMRFLLAHRQLVEFSVLEYNILHSEKRCILKLQMDCEICSYKRGLICNCIPIAGEPLKDYIELKDTLKVDSPEVVVSSPAVQQSLKNLSDIWQDKASAVLISAPPGSGKENFSLSIPYGSGRIDKFNEQKKSVTKISLANGTTKDQERQIFGFQRDDGSIADGLITKAEGTSLFIDEAHYPKKDSGVRASLLRALEAKEYYPVGSQEVRKIKDVQWIFASSLPLIGRKSLSKVPPKDFWTRMTHVLRIEHPLDPKSYKKAGLIEKSAIRQRQEDVLNDMFKFFWWERIENHFGTDPSSVYSNSKTIELKATDRLIRGYIKVLLDKNSINSLASIFAKRFIKIVGYNKLTNISIRGLRSMVSRLFSKYVGLVMTGEKIPNDNNALEDVTEVIKEIMKIANLNSLVEDEKINISGISRFLRNFLG